MTFTQYMKDTLDLMADTDWSAHVDLQDASSGDLKAAATALWLSGEQQPSGDMMIAILKNRYGYFSDDSALANAEDDTRRFMDRADMFKLSHGLTERLNKEMSYYVVRYYENKGWTVIDLGRSLPEPVPLESHEYGTYIFTDGSI